MKIELSHGIPTDVVSMLSIRSLKIFTKKSTINVHAISGNLTNDIQLIKVLKRYSVDLEMVMFDLVKWENQNQNRSNRTAKYFDDAFIQPAGIISRLTDQHAAVAGPINFNSNFLVIEEKEYVDYA